jgi:hypothetical protein
MCVVNHLVFLHWVFYFTHVAIADHCDDKFVRKILFRRWERNIRRWKKVMKKTFAPLYLGARKKEYCNPS